MTKRSLRSPLSQALGYGSAREGAGHWLYQRVTAVALVPLGIWFTASILLLAGEEHATFIAWLQTPLATLLMVLLLIGVFYHMALGLQVVIEDYAASGVRFALVICVRLGCFALAVAGILATLRIATAGG